MDYSKNLSALLKNIAKTYSYENKNIQNNNKKEEETLFDTTNNRESDDFYGGTISLSSNKKEEETTQIQNPSTNQSLTTSNLSKLLKSLSKTAKNTTQNVTQNSTQNQTQKPVTEQSSQNVSQKDTTNKTNNENSQKNEEQKTNNVQYSQTNSLSNLLKSLSKINSNKTETPNSTTKPTESTTPTQTTTNQNNQTDAIQNAFETITNFSKTFNKNNFSEFKLYEKSVENEITYECYSNISSQKLLGKNYKTEESYIQTKNKNGEISETLVAKAIYNENDEIFSINFSLYNNKNELINGYSVVVYQKNSIPTTQINKFENGKLSTEISDGIKKDIKILTGVVTPLEVYYSSENETDIEIETDKEIESENNTEETDGQTKAELFPTEKPKDHTKEKDLIIDEFEQGSLDDCYFISYLRNLETLENTDILEWNEDGSATVKLYDVQQIDYQKSFLENFDGMQHDLIVGERQEYTITPEELSQTNMIINGESKELLTGDITMKAMEIALGKHAMQEGNFDYSEMSRPAIASGLLFGEINYTANAGCYDNQALESAKTCMLPPQDATAFREYTEKTTDFKYNNNGKSLSIQDTSGNTVEIQEKHSYAVLEYNQNKNTVTISDPHYADSKIEINANNFKKAFSINTDKKTSSLKTLLNAGKIMMGL